MGILERGGLLRPTNSWGARAKTQEMRRKCPPVEDCAAQNARPKRPTAKQRREAARIAAAQAAQRKAARKAKGKKQQQPEPEQKQAGWPFAGSYTPKRSRGS